MKRIVSREREVYGLYRDAVSAIIESGEGRKLDPAVVTFALFGVVNYFYHWFKPGGALTLSEAAEQSIALVLNGLLNVPAGSAPRRAKATGVSTRQRSPSTIHSKARQTC